MVTVVQSVERQIVVLVVVGSIPIGHPIFSLHCISQTNQTCMLPIVTILLPSKLQSQGQTMQYYEMQIELHKLIINN